MARLPFGIVNVVTGDDSHAYRSHGKEPAAQITIPRFRARLEVEEARRLLNDLTAALDALDGPIASEFAKDDRVVVNGKLEYGVKVASDYLIILADGADGCVHARKDPGLGRWTIGGRAVTIEKR